MVRSSTRECVLQYSHHRGRRRFEMFWGLVTAVMTESSRLLLSGGFVGTGPMSAVPWLQVEQDLGLNHLELC